MVTICAVAHQLLGRFWRDRQGQDLVEYALMAGFVAVAAGATFPTTIMPAVSSIFSSIQSAFAAMP